MITSRWTLVSLRSAGWLLAVPVACALAACSGESDDTHGDTGADAADTADAADDDADTDLDEDVAEDADTGPRFATEFTAVEIASDTPATVRLAVQACAGLYNRELGGSVYTQASDKDRQWLVELGLEAAEVVDPDTFLATCVADFPTCVRYSYADQQILLPNILTVGASLGAVPLDENIDAPCDEVVFDATVELADHDTPELATRYVFENFVEGTTGLAMLNPGYATQADDLSNPPVTGDMSSALVDFVFAQKLFAVFLINGCQGVSPERQVLSDVVNAGNWPTPLGVYGYNNSWNVGGYLFEAQTLCLDSQNMGAIPTETSNLSFFSTRREPITEPSELEGNTPEEVTYDPEKTYVAFVIGDGDNIAFIMSTRNVWLRQRLDDCAQPDNACAPLTWTISPHLVRIAPDILQWYFARIRETGHDYFGLPPSGHLYAYPGSLLDEGDQERFAAATEDDARLLGASTTVHWEWWETWRSSERNFLPRYAHEDSAIRGLIPVNVPYMFPTFDWWEDDWFYNVLTGEDGGEVVLFRPRQWRGIDDSGSGVTESFFLSPERMAEELAGYPAGTVTAIYMTSDGGLNLENSFMELVRLLPDHVQLVSADAAAQLALDAFHTGDGAQ